jgi:hypothetical protein
MRLLRNADRGTDHKSSAARQTVQRVRAAQCKPPILIKLEQQTSTPAAYSRRGDKAILLASVAITQRL